MGWRVEGHTTSNALCRGRFLPACLPPSGEHTMVQSVPRPDHSLQGVGIRTWAGERNLVIKWC